MSDHDKLRKEVERQARRIKKAESEHGTLMSQTVFIGTLGLVFILPVVAGAYLGRWLDSILAGYSIHWTVSLILLGVIIGMINAYILIRE